MASFTIGNQPVEAKPGLLMHPNGNAYDLAVSHWLDAQLYAAEYQDVSAQLMRCNDRIQNGRVWMMKHRGHPREAHNRNLLAQLEWDRSLLNLQVHDRLLAIRVAVWSVWVCWQHLTATERMTLAWETGLRDLEGPEAMWIRLELDVEMGRMPVTERAHWWRNNQREDE